MPLVLSAEVIRKIINWKKKFWGGKWKARAIQRAAFDKSIIMNHSTQADAKRANWARKWKIVLEVGVAKVKHLHQEEYNTYSQ